MKRTKKLAGCLMLLKFSSFYIMEILSSHHNKETRRTDGVRAFSVSQCSTPLLHAIKTHFTPHFHHWSRPHPLRKLDWRAPKTTPQYPNGSSRSYRLASPPPKKHICGEGTSTPGGRAAPKETSEGNAWRQEKLCPRHPQRQRLRGMV